MFADTFEDVEILDVSAGPDPTQESPIFASVRESLAELQAGRMIVIVDDEDRENEGDLMIAAEMITPEAINFMATRARGLICMAITSERADALELSPMALRNTSWGGTAFMVSVDAKGRGVTTGIGVRPCPNGARDSRRTHTSRRSGTAGAHFSASRSQEWRSGAARSHRSGSRSRSSGWAGSFGCDLRNRER